MPGRGRYRPLAFWGAVVSAAIVAVFGVRDLC
jgi:hypothetical protein